MIITVVCHETGWNGDGLVVVQLAEVARNGGTMLGFSRETRKRVLRER